jgi:hypothetical protein
MSAPTVLIGLWDLHMLTWDGEAPKPLEVAMFDLMAFFSVAVSVPALTSSPNIKSNIH